MTAEEAGWLGRKAQELLKAYREEGEHPRLHTFREVETLWTTVVAPRLPEFRTMQYWDEGEPPAAESRWHANWPLPDRILDGSF